MTRPEEYEDRVLIERTLAGGEGAVEGGYGMASKIGKAADLNAVRRNAGKVARGSEGERLLIGDERDRSCKGRSERNGVIADGGGV